MLGAGYGQELRKANNARLGKSKANNDNRLDRIKRNFKGDKLRDDKLSPEEFETFKKQFQKKKKKDFIKSIIITSVVIIVFCLLLYWILF